MWHEEADIDIGVEGCGGKISLICKELEEKTGYYDKVDVIDFDKHSFKENFKKFAKRIV